MPFKRAPSCATGPRLAKGGERYQNSTRHRSPAAKSECENHRSCWPRKRGISIRNATVVDHGEARAWEYLLPGGWKVLAGKTDEDNEKLSLRLARANDYWFHVHGLPGSHVVLQGPEGEEPDKTVLKAAASVAAYHSKARAAGVVPVSCTKAQNVSKPRGAKPGTVQIKKETILKVRPGLPT